MFISSVGYNSILHEFVSYENNCQQSKVLYQFRLDVQALLRALFSFTLSVDSSLSMSWTSNCFSVQRYSSFWCIQLHFPKLISATGMYFWLYQFVHYRTWTSYLISHYSLEASKDFLEEQNPSLYIIPKSWYQSNICHHNNDFLLLSSSRFDVWKTKSSCHKLD